MYIISNQPRYQSLGFIAPPAPFPTKNALAELQIIREAIEKGIRDENELLNRVFFNRHPERNGRKIATTEPNFNELKTEWLDIRGELVRPELGRANTRVRHFSCSGSDFRAVQAIVGRDVTAAELRAAVETAAKAAVFIALRSAYMLERSPRDATTRKIFGASFGTCPEFLPKGYENKPRSWKDFGELVAIRLRAVARIIQNGGIRYFCWNGVKHCNSPVPGFVPNCDPPEEIYACFGGNSTICFGKYFWEAWKEGISTATTTTILHEALHMYYHLKHSGRLTDIFCYEAFVIRSNFPTLSGQNKEYLDEILKDCAVKPGSCR